MGNPLGPTFANYYMCHLENSILENYLEVKPKLYLRYVDDIFLLVDSIGCITRLKNDFESNSVLKFTFEIQKLNQLPFLDVLIKKMITSFQHRCT
jgi:hypothetical protein